VEILNNRAGVQQQLGRYHQALADYDRALAVRPDYPEALNNRGVTLQALRRPAEALASYDAALSLRPDFVEALVNRGITHYECRRFEDALTDYNGAIALRPDHADALSNRGNALDRLGRHDAALASHDAALKIMPDHIEALYNRGVSLHHLRRFDAALASYDAALALRPDYPEALTGRGMTLHDQRQFEDALRSYERAIALCPGDSRALVNRSATLHELGRSEEALQQLDLVLATDPDHAEALTNRGVILHDLARWHDDAASPADQASASRAGRIEQALDCHDRALAARPDYAEALVNRGATLGHLRRFDAALESYDRALSVRPDYAEALINRGIALVDLKRFEAALDSYDRAIELQPGNADAHFLRGLCRLVTGDFARGWLGYEWRRQAPVARLTPRDCGKPPWRGDGNIAGRTILLHGEQGFGDSIQFCRYVPLVAARGARVVLDVEAPLRRLMNGLVIDDAVGMRIISKGDAVPDVDLECPLPSLPLAFNTGLQTIPADVAYLRPPSEAVAEWGLRLGQRTSRRPRIGLAWSGNPRHVRDRERSMRLRDLLPLWDIDASFVSLQKPIRDADQATLKTCNLLRFDTELADFCDTAALISQLDLVIAVDTGTAHLAGALGKPVWILLTHVPDWRWLLDRDDSPWYPSARLFRQSETRDWGSVIASVRQALIEEGASGR
jgi:tetratricopeptide (TPR) repeat protein